MVYCVDTSATQVMVGYRLGDATSDPVRCDATTLQIVVDLATGKAVKGADLLERMQAVGPSADPDDSWP